MEQQIKQHNKKVLATLEVGDLVEFPREHISHWGVYVGDGEIVHLTASNKASGIGNKEGRVKKEKFWDVVKQSRAKKNNYKDNDSQYKIFDREEIKRRALSKVGPSNYNFVDDNCEHFAMYCRYGKKHSGQVNAFVARCLIIKGAFLALVLLVVYQFRRILKRY